MPAASNDGQVEGVSTNIGSESYKHMFLTLAGAWIPHHESFGHKCQFRSSRVQDHTTRTNLAHVTQELAGAYTRLSDDAVETSEGPTAMTSDCSRVT